MKVTERTDLPGTYMVQGEQETYHLDCREPEWTCDCNSGCWRPERPCRHKIAVAQFKRGER